MQPVHDERRRVPVGRFRFLASILGALAARGATPRTGTCLPRSPAPLRFTAPSGPRIDFRHGLLGLILVVLPVCGDNGEEPGGAGETDTSTSTNGRTDATSETSGASDASGTTKGATSSGAGTSSETTGQGQEVCGDGTQEGEELCDDGNDVDDDGCDADCFPSAVQSVSAGDRHTCALLRTGSIRCWGFGGGGQLGYGNTDSVGDDEEPRLAGSVGLGEPATAVATGRAHTCALLASGVVNCWGENDVGQVGVPGADAIGDDEHPQDAPAVEIGARAVDLVAGYEHTCALTEDSEVVCWGEGAYGRLGYSNEAVVGDDESPASVGSVDLSGDVTYKVAAGWRHTCALGSAGTLRCWGLNNKGQLGLGNTANIGDDETPSSVDPIDVGGSVSHATGGGAMTCAVLDGGVARCWGSGFGGALGSASMEDLGDDESPLSIAPLSVGGSVVQLSAGEFHACVVLEGGAVRCWGVGSAGRLGYGDEEDIGDDELPGSVGPVDVGAKAIAVSAGTWHTCAVLADGALRCWGQGADGRLGYGNEAHVGDDESPASVGDVPVI